MGSTSPDDSRETELIAQVVEGDRKAFQALYELYYPRLYRFIFRLLGSSGDVQEAINDTLYVVWDKAHKFNGTSKVSTWIFGIANNKARTHAAKQRERFANAGSEIAEFTGHDDSWRAAVERENWLEAAMSTLSIDHRAVVELTYYNGLNYREIAEIMGCPENTIKTRMFHARANLKVALRALSQESDPKLSSRAERQ